MFFLLYRHTDDGVFDDFPKISDHSPKISEDCPKLVKNLSTNVSSPGMSLESRMWLRTNFTSGVFSSKTLVSLININRNERTLSIFVEHAWYNGS